jgi:hypothetical protein
MTLEERNKIVAAWNAVAEAASMSHGDRQYHRAIEVATDTVATFLKSHTEQPEGESQKCEP